MKKKDRISVAFKRAQDAWNELLLDTLEIIDELSPDALSSEELWLKIHNDTKDHEMERVLALLDLFEEREAAGVPTPLLKDLAPAKEFERLDPYARQGFNLGAEWPLTWVKPANRGALMQHLIESDHVLLDQALEVPQRQIQRRILSRVPFKLEDQAAFNDVYDLITAYAESDTKSGIQRACCAVKSKIDRSRADYAETVSSSWSDASFR